MPDIFISYSRKDSPQALELAERLRLSGMDIWIDQHGIEAATQWSKEIVEAIEGCRVFLLLLSEHSIVSKNVIQELNIASESERSIIPIEVESVTLPNAFRYQLAGLQRAHFSDFDGIERSLLKLGVARSATRGLELEVPEARVGVPQPTPKPSRVRLAVLPFEDLSPAKDHDWFSDGLTYELIDTLNKLTELFVVDKLTIRDFKTSTLKPKAIARELDVRYVVHGAVLKAGERLRIQCELIDTVTGETLWNDKYNGAMEDIFELQEHVAREIAEGLKLRLTPEDSKKLIEHHTQSAEAYELLMRGMQSGNLVTREGYQSALGFYGQAVAIDPQFADAWLRMANTASLFFRQFSRDPVWLERAGNYIARAEAIEGRTPLVLRQLGFVAHLRGQSEGDDRLTKEAIELLRLAAERAPNDFSIWNTYGAVLGESGSYEEAVVILEHCVELEPDRALSHSNVVQMLIVCQDPVRTKAAALRAVPVFERHLRKNPEDINGLVNLADILYYADKPEEALAHLEAITARERIDSGVLQKAAGTYLLLGRADIAIGLARRAVEGGNRLIALFQSLDFSGTPYAEEHAALVEEMKEMIEQEKRQGVSQ